MPNDSSSVSRFSRLRIFARTCLQEEGGEEEERKIKKVRADKFAL